MSTRRGLTGMETVARKARKKAKRMTFAQKSEFVVEMIERNAQYHEEVFGVKSVGFTMGQIASMTTYVASTALLNTLFQMCDEGALHVDTVKNARCGLSDVVHVFYLPRMWRERPTKKAKALL